MLDPPSNLDGASHVVTYTNVPGDQVFNATILTGTITLTNTVGNTYELFPSGIIINPPTTLGPGGEALLPLSANPLTNFNIARGGDVLLHSEPHLADPNCTHPGFDSFQGAGVLAVPEPGATSLLIGAIALLAIGRRRNSAR